LNSVVSGDEALLEIIQQEKQKIGADDFYRAIRMIILQTIDFFWVDHLEAMDYLRNSVNLRAYGQRDPLVEYKKEGLRLFRVMEETMFDQISRLLPHIGNMLPREKAEELKRTEEAARLITGGGEISKDKIGRNDPCFCGSGKKHKQCHGK
jgi:preprotein translocase subunit SecA